MAMLVCVGLVVVVVVVVTNLAGSAELLESNATSYWQPATSQPTRSSGARASVLSSSSVLPFALHVDGFLHSRARSSAREAVLEGGARGRAASCAKTAASTATVVSHHHQSIDRPRRHMHTHLHIYPSSSSRRTAFPNRSIGSETHYATRTPLERPH